MFFLALFEFSKLLLDNFTLEKQCLNKTLRIRKNLLDHVSVCVLVVLFYSCPPGLRIKYLFYMICRIMKKIKTIPWKKSQKGVPSCQRNVFTEN